MAVCVFFNAIGRFYRNSGIGRKRERRRSMQGAG
jgi:hypothetical protein